MELENKKELHQYLEVDVDSSMHELIRTNVLTATRNYNHRVRAFMRDIVRDKNNPMCVEYFTTKVEFQGRGAAHNHGTFWVNMNKLEYVFVDGEGQWSDFDQIFNQLNHQEMSMKKNIKSILKKFYEEESALDKDDKNVPTLYLRTLGAVHELCRLKIENV